MLFKAIVKAMQNPLNSIWKVIGKWQITHSCVVLLLLSLLEMPELATNLKNLKNTYDT